MSWFRKTPPKPSNGPDYRDIDSMDKIQRLVAEGELVPLFLLPEMFGGQDVKENRVYVPPFVTELKYSTDNNVIVPLAQEGKVTRYTAEPKYSGKSKIPIAIEITAHDPGNFTYELRIWGEALGRPVGELAP